MRIVYIEDEGYIRPKKKLYKTDNSLEISIIIRPGRLEWAGYLKRMDDVRILKSLLKIKISGSKKSRKNWEDIFDGCDEN